MKVKELMVFMKNYNQEDEINITVVSEGVNNDVEIEVMHECMFVCALRPEIIIGLDKNDIIKLLRED